MCVGPKRESHTQIQSLEQKICSLTNIALCGAARWLVPCNQHLDWWPLHKFLPSRVPSEICRCRCLGWGGLKKNRKKGWFIGLFFFFFLAQTHTYARFFLLLLCLVVKYKKPMEYLFQIQSKSPLLWLPFLTFCCLKRSPSSVFTRHSHLFWRVKNSSSSSVTKLCVRTRT